MKPVSQVLEEAADLLAKPGGWTQGQYARDAEGHKTSPFSKVRPPVCFCMLGALRRVVGSTRVTALFRNASVFLPDKGNAWVVNDRAGQTQDGVVAIVHRAAALAKEQGR